jgi:hypothetical protein
MHRLTECAHQLPGEPCVIIEGVSLLLARIEARESEANGLQTSDPEL